MLFFSGKNTCAALTWGVKLSFLRTKRESLIHIEHTVVSLVVVIVSIFISPGGWAPTAAGYLRMTCFPVYVHVTVKAKIRSIISSLLRSLPFYQHHQPIIDLANYVVKSKKNRKFFPFFHCNFSMELCSSFFNRPCFLKGTSKSGSWPSHDPSIFRLKS